MTTSALGGGMTRKRNFIRSDIAWSTSDRVVVQGKDLADEIIGRFNFGDFAYLQIVIRRDLGTPPRSTKSNAYHADRRLDPSPECSLRHKRSLRS